MAERNGLLNRRRGNLAGGSNPPLSAIFLHPPESLNQSKFTPPPLKLAAAKPFTQISSVCLKHTQTARSDSFAPILPRFQSEF